MAPVIEQSMTIRAVRPYQPGPREFATAHGAIRHGKSLLTKQQGDVVTLQAHQVVGYGCSDTSAQLLLSNGHTVEISCKAGFLQWTIVVSAEPQLRVDIQDRIGLRFISDDDPSRPPTIWEPCKVLGSFVGVRLTRMFHNPPWLFVDTDAGGIVSFSILEDVETQCCFLYWSPSS